MATRSYAGRVRYYVNSAPEEIIDLIRAFAKENKLGDTVASRGPVGVQQVRAGYGTWLKIRCLWTCAADSHGQHIELEAKPPLLSSAMLYLSVCLAVVGGVIGGGFLMQWPREADVTGIAPYVFGPLVLSLVLHRAALSLPGGETTDRIEHEFARRLAFCHPRIVYLPADRPPQLSLVACLLPFLAGFVLVSFARIFPIFSMLTVPVVAASTLYVISSRLAISSPTVVWRMILAGWIHIRVKTCLYTYACLGMFFLMGTTFIVLSQEEQHARARFAEALGRPAAYYAPLAVDRSVLTTDVRFLQGVVGKGRRPEALEQLPFITWVALPFLTIVLTLKGMREYIKWLNRWTASRQKPPATPQLPTVYPAVSRPALVGLCAALAAVAVNNLLHLVFTVDILSTLFADRYTISRVVGLSAGWALLDLEAAAEGIPERSPLGIVILLALALPTLLVFLSWAFTVMARVMRCRRRTHRIPVEPRLEELVGRLSSRIAVRMPVVQVTDKDEPCLETLVPWLSLRATLMVSRGALEVLDERELEAAVAHELVHVKHDVPVVLATRWLSALSLFPCNVFALVLDTEQRELRADRAAASVVESSDAMRGAITKISLGSMFVTTRSGGRQTRTTPTTNQRWREAFAQWLGRYANLAYAVTQPEFLPGYAHPTLAERMSALRPDSSEKPNN